MTRANWWNLKLTIIRIRDAHHFANTIASLRKIFNNVSCESQKGAVVPPVFLPRSTGSETVPGCIFKCLSYYEAALCWPSEAQLPSLLFIMMHPQVSRKDCRRIVLSLGVMNCLLNPCQHSIDKPSQKGIVLLAKPLTNTT